MKNKLLILSAIVFGLSSCGVSSSDNVNIDGHDMTYFEDTRVGLCYGVVASRAAFNADATGLGVTCVPCEKVRHLIK